MRLRTGTEAWKVVTEERESIAPLLMGGLRGSKHEDWSEILKFLKRRRILKKYKKGSVVKAEKRSPPLLCFLSRNLAREWVSSWHFLRNKVRIIKVVGYEEVPARVMSFRVSDWRSLFEERLVNERSLRGPIIAGVIAFRKVRVLE